MEGTMAIVPIPIGKISDLAKAVEGLGDHGAKWLKQWQDGQKGRDEASRIQHCREHLDEMLRNRRYRFRSIAVLARAIGDTSPHHQITVTLLQSLGARQNTKTDGTNSWTQPDYWRELNGVWVLAEGVKPGRF
jgi:hypothetical protein